jgi:hypothetical protein
MIALRGSERCPLSAVCRKFVLVIGALSGHTWVALSGELGADLGRLVSTRVGVEER